MLAFSTGNYLGAVVAVSGLFGGGGGPDRAAVRHQQVMAQLANLRAGIEDLKRGQDEIKGMIAQLDENDRKIMQNQRLLYEAVVDLSEQVARSHEILSEEIDRLGRLTLVNLEAIMAERWEGLAQCKGFIEHRPDGRFVNGAMVAQPFVQGEFVSYDALGAHFREWQPALKKCLNFFSDNLETVGDDFTIFALKFYQKNAAGQTNEEIDDFIQMRYLPTVGMLD